MQHAQLLFTSILMIFTIPVLFYIARFIYTALLLNSAPLYITIFYFAMITVIKCVVMKTNPTDHDMVTVIVGPMLYTFWTSHFQKYADEVTITEEYTNAKIR